MSDIRTLLETFRRLDEAEFDKEARVQSNGTVVVGVNITDKVRELPYIDYVRKDIETGEESTVRAYGSVDRLKKAQTRDARLKRGKIVDPNTPKEPAPQTDAELDADSADSGTPPGTNITQADIDAQGAAAADAGMSNKPAEPSADDVDSTDSGTPPKSKPTAKGADLSKADRATAEKAVQDKLARMLELLDALQESISILKNAGILTERELTPAEAAELKQLQAELGQLAQNPNVSNINKRQIQAQLKRVPADIPTAQDDIDAQGAAAAQVGAEPEAGAEAEPEAGAEAEPTREPSGSLYDFSKAGQGGLANNPEEVEAIKELQTDLQALGYDPKGIDGKYGPGTVAAVKAFQKDKGLTADGDAGPDTINAILRAEPEPKAGEPAAKTDEPAVSGEGEDLIKQIKALLDKANIKPDVTSTVDSPIAASIDFKSMIGQGIFESVNLREALSSEDQMKLQGLLNKLNKNHPELAKQNADLFKQAQTFIKTGKVAAPGTPVKGKVAGSSGGTLPNSDARGQKPNTPQAKEPASSAPTKTPGKTTTKTSTDATMKGVAITAAIRKTPEWKQFYKKPVAPKPSLEQAAIRKADLKYKQAVAQGKIKPPAGASVDAKTTTTTAKAGAAPQTKTTTVKAVPGKSQSGTAMSSGPIERDF